MRGKIIIYLLLWFFIGISISRCSARRGYLAEGQFQYFLTKASRTVLKSDVSHDVHSIDSHLSNSSPNADHPSKTMGNSGRNLQPYHNIEAIPCFGSCYCRLIEEKRPPTEHKVTEKEDSTQPAETWRAKPGTTLSVSCRNQVSPAHLKSEAIFSTLDWKLNVSAVLIDGTRLQNLPGDLCQVTSNVLHLTLTRSNQDLKRGITESNIFQCFPNLLSLHISNNNGLNPLNLNLMEMMPTQIQKIVLQENNITRIEGALRGYLAELQLMDLSFNLIEIFNASSRFNLPSLKQLLLSHNNIHLIHSPNADRGLWDKLELLDLSHNALTKMPSFFPGEPIQHSHRGILRSSWRLLELSLSHNNIGQLHAGNFDLAINLIHLDLSFNHVLSITAGIFTSSLANLRTLKLNHNKISHFSLRAFDGLASLQLFNVSHNLLTVVLGHEFYERLAPNLADWMGSVAVNYTSAWNDLQTVDLSHNNISSLAKETFQVRPFQINCAF